MKHGASSSYAITVRPPEECSPHQFFGCRKPVSRLAIAIAAARCHAERGPVGFGNPPRRGTPRTSRRCKGCSCGTASRSPGSSRGPLDQSARCCRAAPRAATAATQRHQRSQPAAAVTHDHISRIRLSQRLTGCARPPPLRSDGDRLAQLFVGKHPPHPVDPGPRNPLHNDRPGQPAGIPDLLDREHARRQNRFRSSCAPLVQPRHCAHRVLTGHAYKATSFQRRDGALISRRAGHRCLPALRTRVAARTKSTDRQRSSSI